jgi:hypothetical protein
MEQENQIRLRRLELVTTLMAVPAYRADAPDKPVIYFEEQPSRSAEAIHTWFYPGEHTG